MRPPYARVGTAPECTSAQKCAASPGVGPIAGATSLPSAWPRSSHAYSLLVGDAATGLKLARQAWPRPVPRLLGVHVLPTRAASMQRLGPIVRRAIHPCPTHRHHWVKPPPGMVRGPICLPCVAPGEPAAERAPSGIAPGFSSCELDWDLTIRHELTTRCNERARLGAVRPWSIRPEETTICCNACHSSWATGVISAVRSLAG